jgi:3D (Asp-Asp-Asp) domain-containing protein
MKNRKALLVGTILTISMLTTLTAQAGLMEWLGVSDAQAQRASTGSFDQLYAAVMAEGTAASDAPVLTANSSAVMAVTSPVGGVQKTLRRTYRVEVSAYNSEVAQCDDSPFITAKGTHVRDGIVATNMFPFGTVIKIPSMFGDKIFVVEDRMNTRYQNNVDVWMESKADALKLGRRTVTIEVIQ